MFPNFRDYISITRPGHWIKQIFVLIGVIFAMVIFRVNPVSYLYLVVIGLISSSLIASSNYAINEWLDANYDRHHPTKKNRPAVKGRINAKGVYILYGILSISGFGIAFLISKEFAFYIFIFFLSGIIYNIRPFRTKEKVYFDVLTEAVNNPIRLLIGWCVISNSTLPPGSLLAAYWFGGAFLMATKRLAEYKFICREDGKEAAANYRYSFAHYTENSLVLSCFVYGVLSFFFITFFLSKYRIEYILLIPFLASLFTYYLWLGLKESSLVQSPEKLYKDFNLIIIIALLIAVTCILSFIDIPQLEELLSKRFQYKF